jgi:hypothetical protein
MKTFFLISLVTTCFVSCKKNEATTCDINMTEIAGNYKFSKLEKVSYTTGVTQDITSTLTNCDFSGMYTFNTDSTAEYSELAICNGNSSGSWNLSGTWIYTTFNSSNANRITGTLIESWDCSRLVLLTRYPSVDYNFRITLSKLQN